MLGFVLRLSLLLNVLLKFKDFVLLLYLKILD